MLTVFKNKRFRKYAGIGIGLIVVLGGFMSLSNLYVGLHRWLRGERLAAMHMVQVQALDNLLRLQGTDDAFAPARRAERWGLPLHVLAGGYDATPAAAAMILDMVATEDHMADEVRALLDRC